jgi:hypothetical protein
MFVDMMGFAALTTANPALVHADFQSVSMFGRSGSTANELAIRFVTFHKLVSIEIAEMARGASDDRPIQAITFSDSAFIVQTGLAHVVSTAARLMRSLILEGIPTRIGIGVGSFSLLGFRSETAAGASIHSSQFLGTAVVNAHEAERAGLPGFRIFLHRSTEVLAARERLRHPQLLRLDQPDSVESREGYPFFEANYCSPSNEDTDEQLAKGLMSMRRSAPNRALRHYTATYEAFDRMRLARNRQPFFATR